MKKGKLVKQGKVWIIESSELKKGTMTVQGDFGLTEDLAEKDIEFDNTGGSLLMIRIDNKEYKPSDIRKLEGKIKREVHQTRRGTEIEHYFFISGKTKVEIKWRKNLPVSFDGKPVEAEFKVNELVAINYNGKRYTDVYGVAPYNFIELNQYPVLSVGKRTNDRYHNDLFSGYIYLNIKSLTPFFIRGNREDFLRINNEVIIQGSALRGLVRNLLEISSYGKFDNKRFRDERMYYRAMADMAIHLRDQYKSEIASGVEAGYLNYDKKTKKYSITPAQGFDRSRGVRGEFKYYANGADIEVHSGKMNNKRRNWLINPISTSQPITIDERLIDAYGNDKNRNINVDILKAAREGKIGRLKLSNGIPVFYKRSGTEITSFGHTRNYRLPYSSYISHHIHNKLHENGFIDFADAIFGTEEYSGKVYFEDAFSENSTQLKPRVLQILGTPNPTTFQYYLEQEPLGKDTPMYKLKHWDNNNAIIRGYKQYWHKNTNSSNIDLNYKWFVDSFQIKRKQFVTFLKNVNRIKNPDSFLDKYSSSFESIEDANQEIKLNITGELSSLPEVFRKVVIEYFFLEHHIAAKYNIKKPQNTIAACIEENSKFQSRIRYENLTKEELGALLFVLDLPSDCAHKLGMGKPLGLGSISIRVDHLITIDRKSRYEKLFEKDGEGNWNWNTAGTDELSKVEEFKKAFAKYICDRIGASYDDDKGAHSLWEVERMQQLKTMLTWPYNEKGEFIGFNGQKPADWLERTRYMRIDHPELGNEFKNRPVLPYPDEVVDKDTYKDC